MNTRGRGPVGPHLPAYARDQIDPPTQGNAQGRAPTTASSTREVIHTIVPSLNDLRGDGTYQFPESTVAQTSKAWAGVDVYVQLPVPFTSPLGAVVSGVHVFVYAISNGQKQLAASGRIVPGPLETFAATLDAPLAKPTWAAAARGYPDSWEVTAIWIPTIASFTPAGPVHVYVEASNELAPIPPGLGSVSMGTILALGGGTFATLGIAGVFNVPAPALELLSVQGVNAAGAARYLHVHDVALATVVGVAGASPVLCFPMGEAAGDGISETEIYYRAREHLVLVPSSTPTSTTPVLDCGVSAMVR